MAKIYTLFVTETAEKPYPLGLHIPISPYKGVPPPGGYLSADIICSESEARGKL